MNRYEEKKTRLPNPVSTASFLSKITFWWLKPMFEIGLKREIEADDIYAVTNSMRSEQNTEAYAKQWESELKKKNPSLFRAMFNVHGVEIFSIGMLFALCETFSKLFQPICLGGFVSYFSQADGPEISFNDAFWYASGIVFSSAFMLVTFHPFTLYMTKMTCIIRVACSGLIYQKILRLTKSSAEEGQSGKIINLLSTDLNRLEVGVETIHDIWTGPFEAITFFIIIYIEIGMSAAVGMIFLLSFVPLQAWIGKKSAVLRTKNIERTDIRVKIMDEIIVGIQIIKMYAWEKSFARLVDQIRRKEMKVIRSISYIRATISSFTMISKLSIFLSLVSYVYFGNVITARKVFMVSSYFEYLNTSMIYSWPIALTHVAEAYVSLHRLHEFLLRPESRKPVKNINEEAHNDDVVQNGEIIKGSNGSSIFDKNYQKYCDVNTNYDNGIAFIAYSSKLDGTPGKRIQNINSTKKFICMENVTAMWDRTDINQMNGIVNLNIEIKPGLCAIIGQVGSRKSTLLNVILGELNPDVGTVIVNGSTSYACQEPWLFGGSIRSNIIFVEDFDARRYKEVVDVCALEEDFKMFPRGDASMVGERGLSLSGGQKARINLARAIYKQSDIYLLDDPLSAVDAHVGKHIFERCIKGFLADKICVLVTHQLQYLENEEHVIILKNGQVEAEGPFKTLQKFNKDSLTQDPDAVDSDQDRKRHLSSTSSFYDDGDDDDEEFEDDRKERQLTGSIKTSTYKAFFRAAQNNLYVIVVLIMFIAAQFTYSGADYFLAEWVDWEEDVVIEKLNASKQSNELAADNLESIDNERQTYVIVYSGIMLIGTIIYLSHAFCFFQMCLRISVNFHDMIFQGISRAKMFFFNNNPSGRILNRFSRDIDYVDSELPHIMIDVFECFLLYVGAIVIDAIVNPMLLIPAVIMTILFYIMRIIYVNTGRSFMRVEAISYSSIYSHVNVTLQGLPTVRAFNAAGMLEKEFHEFQDHNSSCWYLFNCASRWFALWLDVVCVLFIAIVVYSFLLLDSMDIQGGKVGLAILSSIGLIGTCQLGMRQSADLESKMTSVERILEYADLPSEPPLDSDKKNAPPKGWPTLGNIEFKSLSLRYAENAARILHSLTFRIDAKQKIGIVGRTGAGKSSIIQSIFRLAENEGHIFIDGVDVGLIGLHDLRKNISIIPQDAVLFSGSLRFNLDPFGERTDSELWDALDQVELKTVVSAWPGGIDSKVLDGGSNFSAGQRQLVCLARAILRNNKIIILDEATSNCDPDTDKLIQETIRRKFADCTVITIAHRLHTIMDSDKVIVVDAGEIMEFDHPFELIKKPDGIFKRLLNEAGSSTVAELTIIAKENYENQMEQQQSFQTDDKHDVKQKMN